MLPDGLGVEAEEERDDPDYQLRPGDCGDDDEDDDGGDGGVDRQLVRMGYRLLVRGCKGL